MNAGVAENGKSIHRKPVQDKESDRVMTKDEIYQARVERDARNYPSKSVLRRLEKTTGIKTQAGLEMFEYFNTNYGSDVWGKVLEGIQAIEKELG